MRFVLFNIVVVAALAYLVSGGELSLDRFVQEAAPLPQAASAAAPLPSPAPAPKARPDPVPDEPAPDERAAVEQPAPVQAPAPMSPDKRRRDLHRLAEDMELMFVDSVGE